MMDGKDTELGILIQVTPPDKFTQFYYRLAIFQSKNNLWMDNPEVARSDPSGTVKMGRQVAFILHGRTRGQTHLRHEIRRVFEPDYRIHFFATAFAGHGQQLAREAIQAGLLCLVAIGGDGTVNDVVNGMLDAVASIQAVSLDHLRLGILGRGSGNDFIRNMAGARSIRELYEDIRQDRNIWVDLGELDFAGIESERAKRLFINIADIGLGGVVAHRITRIPRWVPPLLKYQFSIIHTLLQYRHQRIRISGPQQHREGTILALILANGKFFGKGLGIAPHAHLQDKLLAVVWIGNVTIREYLRYLPRIRRCLPIEHPELEYFNTNNLSIDHLDRPLPIDMDGEFVGYTPARLSVHPHSLRVYGTLLEG
ncbi:MAG: hypothetical protein KDC57_00655 [Saprospiraceae bacterium]|nr:hypothetical protein [Saprospiraceae bacterium]